MSDKQEDKISTTAQSDIVLYQSVDKKRKVKDIPYSLNRIFC